MKVVHISILKSLLAIAVATFLIGLLVNYTPVRATTLLLNPTDDAHTKSSKPNNNYGKSRKLELDTGRVNKNIFIKFDLRQISSPVNRATLRMKIANSSKDNQYIRVVPDSTWQEASITYNNQPEMLLSVVATMNGGKRGKWVEADLTNTVNSFRGQLLSLGFENNGRDGFDLNSKEKGSDIPELVIETSQTPTPTPTPIPTATPVPTTTPVSTPTPTPTPIGGVTLNPTDDTFTNASNPSINYGSGNQLEIDLASDLKTSFLKFDLSNTALVNSATLSLYVTGNSSSTQNLKHVPNTSWGEHTISYNTQPPLGDLVTTLNGGIDDTWINLDITSVVQSEAGGLIAFAIDSNGTDGLDLSSKEGIHAPKLTINGTAATPTPTPSGTPPLPTSTPVSINPDLNGDGQINKDDYDILLQNFGTSHCAQNGDLDGDCDIDIFDIGAMLYAIQTNN